MVEPFSIVSRVKTIYLTQAYGGDIEFAVSSYYLGQIYS
jgi:hypothetical protein